jgi:hypothetical protein
MRLHSHKPRESRGVLLQVRAKYLSYSYFAGELSTFVTTSALCNSTSTSGSLDLPSGDRSVQTEEGAEIDSKQGWLTPTCTRQVFQAWPNHGKNLCVLCALVVLFFVSLL